MDRGQAFALFGDIVSSSADGTLATHPHSYLVCDEGRVAGVFKALPEQYAGIRTEDHSGRLVLPGLVDLHLHAPQFAFLGLGMDYELMDWLQFVTFPEEAKYGNIEYAREAYEHFTGALAAGATTRACVFATQHVPATLLLMDLLEEAGMCCYVGKVNMDSGAGGQLLEEGAGAALRDTRAWLDACRGRYERVQPILTPRFIPACTEELLRGLGELQRETGLPVQSHLAENRDEVALVRELFPEADSYADAYDRFGLFGGENCPTIMAHCVWPEHGETELMRRRGVFVAHCPDSNANLASGIAPVRRYMMAGVDVGLGTDAAGGATLSIFRVMAEAVQHSKLRWQMRGQEHAGAPLSLPEAFFLATRGGGAFFGKVGAFEPGYEFDALVVDDSRLAGPARLDLAQRLERVAYLSCEGDIYRKYVAGRRVH